MAMSELSYPQPRIPRFELSVTAQNVLMELGRARGPHVLVMRSECAAPAVVHVVAAAEYRPNPGERLVTVVSGHALWAEESALRRCPHEVIVLSPGTRRSGAFHLIARAGDPSGTRRSA